MMHLGCVVWCVACKGVWRARGQAMGASRFDRSINQLAQSQSSERASTSILPPKQASAVHRRPRIARAQSRARSSQWRKRIDRAAKQSIDRSRSCIYPLTKTALSIDRTGRRKREGSGYGGSIELAYPHRSSSPPPPQEASTTRHASAPTTTMMRGRRAAEQGEKSLAVLRRAFGL